MTTPPTCRCRFQRCGQCQDPNEQRPRLALMLLAAPAVMEVDGEWKEDTGED